MSLIILNPTLNSKYISEDKAYQKEAPVIESIIY